MLAGAAVAGKRPALSLLRLGRGVGIREQLWLEEALLRHDKRNWWVVEGWGGSMGGQLGDQIDSPLFVPNRPLSQVSFYFDSKCARTQ